jgi:Holliday junction resolvasome RuvABC endonuclease subunit
MILCLDLSLSNSGVSLFDNSGNIELCFSIPTNAKDTHGERLNIIADKLLEIKQKYKIDILVIENGFIMHNKSSQAIFKVRGVVEYLFYNCELILYPPTTVKKAITGKGSAKKEELQQKLENCFNIKFKDLDQSDSFALGITYFLEKGIINW